MFGELNYDIELKPAEVVSLPKDASQIVGPGHWLISIRPAGAEPYTPLVRDHSAFLNSYALEDEGLYDAYPPG
jgi:hypothetical protein